MNQYRLEFRSEVKFISATGDVLLSSIGNENVNFPAIVIQGLFLPGAIAILYGALVSMVQPNLKRLVAYSSISHMGFVTLGLFSFNLIAFQGAIYVMLAHGITSSALMWRVLRRLGADVPHRAAGRRGA